MYECQGSGDGGCGMNWEIGIDIYTLLSIKQITKESTCQCRRRGFHPWVGRFPGEGNDNPLQYYCLRSPMDRGACWVTVRGVAKESGMTQQLNNNNGNLLYSTENSAQCSVVTYVGRKYTQEQTRTVPGSAGGGLCSHSYSVTQTDSYSYNFIRRLLNHPKDQLPRYPV